MTGGKQIVSGTPPTPPQNLDHFGKQQRASARIMNEISKGIIAAALRSGWIVTVVHDSIVLTKGETQT